MNEEEKALRAQIAAYLRGKADELDRENVAHSKSQISWVFALKEAARDIEAGRDRKST